MKFTCLQENFLRGLQIAKYSSQRPSTLPILQNFLLKTEAGGLTVSSTNLEIAIRVHIRGKEEQEGSITIPQDILTTYIRNLSQSKLDLLSDDNIRLTITQGESTSAEFNGLIASDFPELPQISPEYQVAFQIQELKHSLKKVFSALPKNDFRPEISGVYLNKKAQTLTFVGTDGFRLSEQKIQIPSLDSSEFSIIIPSKTVSELIRILDLVEDEEGVLSIGENQLLFSTSTVEVFSKLIEGNFPQYEALVPQSFQYTIELDPQELTQGIKLSSVFSQNTVNDVKLTFSGGSATISSTNAMVGKNTTQIPIHSDATDFSISVAFNYGYLLDGIALAGGETLVFCLNDIDSPVILKNPQHTDYFYLIMPIRE